MNAASNLPGAWVIICFYVCQCSAQLMTPCQLGEVANWMAPLARVSQYSRACVRTTLDPVRRVDCNWMYSSNTSTYLAFSLINDSNVTQLAISCRPTERFSTFAEGLPRRLPPPSPAALRCEKSDPSTLQLPLIKRIELDLQGRTLAWIWLRHSWLFVIYASLKEEGKK